MSSGPGLFAPAHNPIAIDPRPEPLSAYDSNLIQHLRQHSIICYDNDLRGPRPNNIDGITARLREPRPDVATFGPDEFQDYMNIIYRAEGALVIDRLIEAMAGPQGAPKERDVEFRNLEPLTEHAHLTPAPCALDAAAAGAIDDDVAWELSRSIVVLRADGENDDEARMLPNFIVDARGVWEAWDVVERARACYHGAYAARAMHALQNYGRGEVPVYDGNAYAFTVTYDFEQGTLTIYAHFVTTPTVGGAGRPRFHMWQVGRYNMKGRLEEWQAGATAFRNARELAALWREEVIAPVAAMEPSSTDASGSS